MNKNKGKEIIKMIISTLIMIIIGIVLVGIISNNIILAVTYDWESSTQHSYWTNNGSTKVYEYHTSSSWSYEGNGTHWALCSKCNGAATFSCSGGSHYNGGRCTTCGGVYQTHANSGRVSYYSITATTHTPMYACTTSGCGVTYAGTAAGHTGGTSSNGGRCTVCNYQYQFAPTYTSCEIKNATKDGYDVYIYGVADQNGVNRVEFPTWTAANGQDDLVQPWPRGTDLGNGTWYYRVNASEHNNEGGTYYTHIYIYDNLGDSALATTQTVYVDKTPPTCTSAEIKNVSQTGYDVYVYGVSDANSGVSKVAFPTWTDANGQDDLVQPWPEGTDLGEGTWYYRVNISDHNNEVGKYITHIYLYDNAGNSVLGKTLETFVDTVPPNPGTITVDKQYTNQLNVTSYVVGASDNESGLRDVLICGGYGNTWISNFKGITATYDSTNNRYYANFNLAEIPNVSTGEVNQGEGTYIFNAHAYDNANNEAMTGTVEVIYDITPPSFSIDTTSCTWRNSPLSVIITAEDPISNGVNSRINETSLQYYLSTSSTELLGGEWKNYASGTAFEINPQVSGTYYLFVKNVIDNAGNVGTSNQGIATTIDGEIYQCFGTYQFDYEKPTIGKLYMKEGNIDGEDYINNTLTTKNIYVYVEDGTDALSGHVSTTYKINGGEAKLSGKENATELTASGIYFIVVTTIDNSGNVSTSSAYIVNINSVSLEQSSYLDYGIIKPIYKPEWTKIGSTLDIDGKTLTVELKGSAYESEEIDENVNINYSSNVTSTLSAEDIKVFIDGVEVTNSTNPTVTVNSGTTSINEVSGKNEITHMVQLSNLEEAIRQTGIPYKEWSGNISLKIKGRGQGADTYTADVLVDEYGNQNMMETDENGINADGTWIDIKFEDTEVTQNTIGKMFADFIKPEITYVYSDLDIDYTGKTAKVIFSVTDKYFEQSTLTIDDLRILVDGEEPDWATVEEASSTDNTKPVKELTNTTDVTQEINGVQKIVGKEYTITLKNLQQTPNNGYDYSGIVTVLIPQGKVSDTSGNINDAQTITVGVNTADEEEIETNSPYIPEGYLHVDGTTLENGYVIEDKLGNQYVWVEIPKTAEVYKTAGLNVQQFTEQDYTNIYNDLKTYSSNVRIYALGDNFGSEEATGLTETEYNTQKMKMLKSIYKNGGFYVGRYETGTTTNRTNSGDTTQTPVIKRNVYPYYNVTVAQAQELSSKFTSELDGYTSSLLFDLQWDLVLKYLNENGGTVDEIRNDSTGWGNYQASSFVITNTDAKYNSSNWTNITQPISKNTGTVLSLTTGASDMFAKQNIYDIAGNYSEWVLGYGNDDYPASSRGGNYNSSTQAYNSASFSAIHALNAYGNLVGFRVSLYKDEGIGSDISVKEPYIPEGYTHVEETNIENGYVVKDSKGNEYVWVEVPRISQVYETAGVNVTSFTDENYEKIENDLKSYTSTYRNGTSFKDEYSGSETSTGLNEEEYNTLKKKMLKSIYINEGFYIGRYETGIEDSYRTSSTQELQEPVIKQHAYPYNYVTNSQAQELSNRFSSEGYTTSLIFGIQWDLTLKYLETKGTTQADIKDNSINWGNYSDSNFEITDQNSKYSLDDGMTWEIGNSYIKNTGDKIITTSGANPTLQKQNIYDLGGNLYEWTLEYTNNTYPCANRGGNYNFSGITYAASSRGFGGTSQSNNMSGFRTVLFKDEGMGTYPEGSVVVDVVDPIISVTEDGLSSRNEENSIDTTEKTVTVIIQGEDKYLAQGNLLSQEYIDKIKVQIEDYNGNIIEDASAQELKITKPDGTNIEDQTELSKYTTRVIKNITEIDSTDTTIAYQIVLSNFGKFEGKVTLIIPEGAIVDTSGNENLETPVLIGNSTYTTSFKDSMVDFIRPIWKYVNANTTRLETEGRISFTVKGIDTRLDLANSNLEVSDLKIMKDGELYLDGTNAEDATKISINNDETNSTEKSKTYTITLTGLTETGTYSLVLTKDILIDEFSNTNVGTTITFSNAELPSNTDKYNNITYHVSTNIESEHKSYVHELLTGNTTSYRPSTIGELFNNGENPLFAESMYETLETGETIYAPKSFAGWAEADSNGNAIENGTIYGLYDEIPNSVTHLKAMWQDATVVFVSASTGNNANSGKLPTEPVQDIQTAYNKLNSAGTAENNIIVIMDAVEWNNTETLTGNATITNLYAGIDYRTQGAELKISSDMTIKGDITFDNIKLYTDDINNNLIINSNSDVILSRGITTPTDKYTFGTVEGGNLEPETIRIEAGKYNSIIAGSTETTGTTAGTIHKVVIGNKRDALVGNNEKLTITSEDRAIYLRALNGTTKGTVDFEMYSGKVKGNIYGGASSSETGISTVANNMAFYGGEIDGDIYGGNDNGFIESSKITLENQLYSTIKFEGSIFGAGKNEKVINTSIYLTNFGTTSEPQRLVSIERVENVYIGNSCIELTGRSDTSNLNPKASYTLNNIKSALTIYDNTTLYLQRGFNKVGGFNSYSELNEDNTGTKATMTNTQNKLYTLEGVNLTFAKVEGDLSDRNTEDIWGDVNGMTSFGLYTVNENGEKQYDEDLFKIGTYVEGREKTNHDIAIDGFYKSFSDGSYEIIGIIDNGTNYDWILGEKVKKYEVQLIASKSEKDGTAELELDYNYLPEATYEITGISTNSLVNANNININLIDPLTVPITSQDANNTFGLTVETIESGWYSQETATIYKNSIGGDALFEKDNSTSPGTIRFKIHNSTNITEENDLGYINLLLTGTNPNGESFDIVVAVNLKTVVEESLEVEETEKLQYIPTFTNKEEKELNYTTDSKVDITYTMYKEVTENPYSTGDYRVLSSTMKLPAGTRITMNDRAKNKVYYYHVTGNETEYRLSDFIEMDSLNSYYTDSDTYYHQTDGYVLEKYDISIDFLDANISSNQLLQEIYLELRSADGAVKYDNGDTSITYSLYYNKNAIMEETINNEGQTYLVSENNEIQFTIDASLIEQETANNNIIMDTKYYDKMEGIIVEIIDEHGERVKIPENGEIKIVNANDTTENYLADSTGVIRIPLMQGLSSITKNYKMIIDEQDIASGNCTVNIYFFASDNGKHMGNEENISKQFNITFGEEQEIGIKVEATNESRVINQETGLNLEGNSGIDMKITVEKPITESNIRVELYKRDETYTDVNDESTYTGTSYTLVDLKDYLDGTWKTPEQSDSLLKSDGNYQYVIMSRKIHTSLTEIIDLKNAIKENIATGEYKLVIKLYERNTLVETLRKTFIITK